MRQLTLEDSIRTKTGGLSFRTVLAGKAFTLHGNETRAAIRRIDHEMARYSKFIGTLSALGPNPLENPLYLSLSKRFRDVSCLI